MKLKLTKTPGGGCSIIVESDPDPVSADSFILTMPISMGFYDQAIESAYGNTDLINIENRTAENGVEICEITDKNHVKLFAQFKN